MPFPIHLSIFSEIHQSLDYEDYECQSFNDIDSFATQKKIDSSVISLTEIPPEKYFKNGIPFYLIKVADIIPSDIDELKKKEYHRKLRPEFFLNYKTPLNPDVFLIAEKFTENMRKDNFEAMQASYSLQNDYIRQFLKKLEEKDYFPMESYSLKEMFHNQGVNMRYLGKIAKYTVLPHIKQICIVDMIARKIKTIFRYYIADFIGNLQKNENRKRSIIFWILIFGIKNKKNFLSIKVK